MADKSQVSYNWIKLKREFMLSNYATVTDFMMSKFGKYTGNMRKKTTGWREEKKKKSREITDTMVNDAVNRAVKDDLPSLQDAVKTMVEAKTGFGVEVAKALKTYNYKHLIYDPKMTNQAMSLANYLREELNQPMVEKDTGKPNENLDSILNALRGDNKKETETED